MEMVIISSRNSNIEVKAKSKEFLVKNYADYIKKMFNITPKIIPGSNNANAHRCYFNSSEVNGFLRKIGFVSPKTFTIRMPEKIRKGSIENKISFVRGVFDSDGCITTKRNKKIIPAACREKAFSPI